MTILPDGQQVPVRQGETILEALYASGYSFRVGCRRGGCAICKVDLRSGDVTYNRVVAEAVLTPEERADGTCLTCRAVPQTDVSIELRDESVRLTNAMLRRVRLAQYAKATGVTPQPDDVEKPSSTALTSLGEPPTRTDGDAGSTINKEA